MRIIIVLGSPNSNEGVLSEMVKSRVEVCLSLFEKNNTGIVLTGGYGAHFNTTGKPHAFYLKEALLKKWNSGKGDFSAWLSRAILWKTRRYRNRL